MADPIEPCPHCPDGHRDPTTRPWSTSVSVYRDRDRQPTHLIVVPSVGGHVAESDAQWLRQAIRDAKARAVPVIDFPAEVAPEEIARFKAAWEQAQGDPVEYRQAGEKIDG